MKTYKIKVNSIHSPNNSFDLDVSADQIRAIIKDNPELLEEKKGCRYFFPKEGEEYYGYHGSLISCNILSFASDELVKLGVYRTKEEANLAHDKQKAIVSCWKWQQENAPFEPDWSNEDESKYYVYYDFGLKLFRLELDSIHANGFKTQFTLPYFESQEDCEKFIKANKANLELLFTE